MNSDIVKDSTTLKQALLDRWEEIGITYGMISEDAKKRGVKGITERAISVWKNHSYAKGALNQYQILFLCWRYGVNVSLKVGIPVLYKEGEETKLKYVVEQPYNEEKSLTQLYVMFPGLKRPRKRVRNNG